MDHFDFVVLGCGAMGSAAVLAAARAGHRVLGIDRWHPPHGNGSSHGNTRVIRQAYFEHPDYVPLLIRAYQLWDELEQAVEQSLFIKSGILEVGPADGIVVPGVLRSAALHGLEVERLSVAEVSRRFPRFRVPPGCEVVFERQAGYLLAEACWNASLAVAARLGANFEFNCDRAEVRRQTQSILVQTNHRRVSCERLIVTLGAFTAGVMPELKLPLQVLCKHLHWFTVQDGSSTATSGAELSSEPVFFYETPTGAYYGFPPAIHPGTTAADLPLRTTIKVAEHSGGETVPDPANVFRGIDAGERSRVESFLHEHLRGKYTHHDHRVCMYTMTPDANFVLDFHPEDPRIVLGCGFSGHGFKFASAIGELLVKYATTGLYAESAKFLRSRW